MTVSTLAPGPRLYYRATCPRCRVISVALVWLSLGTVRRVPMATAEAQTVYEAHHQEQGRPALFYSGRFLTGWRILPFLVAAVLKFPFRALTPSRRALPRLP